MKYKAKKKYGQNFLTDELVIANIIGSVNVLDGNKILEIGPGKGYLTKRLKDFKVPVVSFEIDLDMKKYLNSLEDSLTTIVYKDFLEVNLLDYFNMEDNINVIANIPYYITTPIIEKIISSKLNILDMTLMVQKEVADRFSAKPGNSEYGYISVYLNYYFDIEKLFDVDRNSFDPIPNVDSAVIKLTKKNSRIKVYNEEIFFNFVKDAFKMKRKNLKNNLKGYNLASIEKVLKKYSLDLSYRAEDVSLEVFIEMFNSVL